MITKERLEELIKKDASIYGIDYGRYLMAEIVNINTKDLHYCGSNDNFQYVYKENGDCYLYEFSEKELFEAKEDAEFHKEFKRIPRTEYLDLPTYEKFLIDKEFYFNSKAGSEVGLLIVGNQIFIKLTWGGAYYAKKLSKENYRHACVIARELFLGDKDEY